MGLQIEKRGYNNTSLCREKKNESISVKLFYFWKSARTLSLKKTKQQSKLERFILTLDEAQTDVKNYAVAEHDIVREMWLVWQYANYVEYLNKYFLDSQSAFTYYYVSICILERTLLMHWSRSESKHSIYYVLLRVFPHIQKSISRQNFALFLFWVRKKKSKVVRRKRRTSSIPI